MSYTEKPDEITKDEWMEKLNNLHVQRADMNRLIMNYLVTGNGWQPGCYSFSLGVRMVRTVALRCHGNARGVRALRNAGLPE